MYQIDCRDCSTYYVGQTGRKLSTRLHEHKLAIRRHDQLSLISIHQDKFGHEFDLEGTKILATASHKYAREFLEAWFSSHDAINRHINLDSTYEWLKSIQKPARRDYQTIT